MTIRYHIYIAGSVAVALAGCRPGAVSRRDDVAGGKAPAPAAAVAVAGKPHLNRLAGESSPYLLLHAHNPVDWFPWGAEAFEKAKAEDKPILLSVGYSACRWCHVMERESFSDEEVAALMNAGFVCIKVDREERPDVDQIYMAAVQALTGGGGWPMTVFLTPEGRPFFGGTYFPKDDRDGAPGFRSLLKEIRSAWGDRRKEITTASEDLANAVTRSIERRSTRDVPLSRELAAEGLDELADAFDPAYGGFGYSPANPKRPKFPEPPNLFYLLDQHRRGAKAGPNRRGPLDMVKKTMDEIVRGGIRDQLAGGFHRYSTDRSWTVPHFEKMLYDNAQLALVLTELFAITRDPRYQSEAIAALDFIARDLSAGENLFAASLDAESQGEEGKSYVWTRDEIKQALHDDSDFQFASVIFGLDKPPNFEGERYVLKRPATFEDEAKRLGLSEAAVAAKLESVRAKLLAARGLRPSPAKDDKVITSWNALGISAFAAAGAAFEAPKLVARAERAAEALLSVQKTPAGELARVSRGGKASLPATLEDYAFLIDALLRVSAATGRADDRAPAERLAKEMIDRFSDPKTGGFFNTQGNRSDLFVRPREWVDGVMPSGASAAATALVRLAKAGAPGEFLDRANRALTDVSGLVADRPGAAPMMLVAIDACLDARPVSAAPQKK